MELTIQQQKIINNVSLEIFAHDRIGIVGPSGAGKSSLFRMMNLLTMPTGGTILYKNKDILEYSPLDLRRQIGYVLQKPWLFGSTVEENLFYPYYLLNQSPDRKEIRTYLEQTGLAAAILLKPPATLSGGEQQRIALIRSLLMKPDLLLLDEVTSALDYESTLSLERLLLTEYTARKLTLLFISHNAEQAQRMAQKILHLEQGKVTFFGTTDDYYGGRRCNE